MKTLLDHQFQNRAPSPAGHWLWGHLHPFRDDVLGLLTRAVRECGDVVRFRLGPDLIHLVNHPDEIGEVLRENHAAFDKDTRSTAHMRVLVGDNLLTLNGPSWFRQRRLMQPAFHHQSLARFADLMVENTSHLLARWREAAAAGQPVDAASEMTRLTFAIVAEALFSTRLGGEIFIAEEAIGEALHFIYYRLSHPLHAPLWLPTPGNRRFKNAVAALNRGIYRGIKKRREEGESEARNDLLALLLNARDADTGAAMSDRELRNEAMTLLIAGHETTANALTWTLWLLAQHPAAMARLKEEVRAVLGDRPPSLDDLPRLEYTAQVIQEAMRLYPPIWIMERQAREDVVICGHDIPSGSSVVVCPYTLHRHPGFWPNAEQFDPDRFAPEALAERPRLAYLPFGEGPRLCIGKNFALMEAKIILSMTMQAFDLELLPQEPVLPQPGLTLRPNRAVMMQVSPKTP